MQVLSDEYPACHQLTSFPHMGAKKAAVNVAIGLPIQPVANISITRMSAFGRTPDVRPPCSPSTTDPQGALWSAVSGYLSVGFPAMTALNVIDKNRLRVYVMGNGVFHSKVSSSCGINLKFKAK